MKVLVIISVFCPWGGGHLQVFLSLFNIILASKHVLRILPYPCEKGPMGSEPTLGLDWGMGRYLRYQCCS